MLKRSKTLIVDQKGASMVTMMMITAMMAAIVMDVYQLNLSIVRTTKIQSDSRLFEVLVERVRHRLVTACYDTIGEGNGNQPINNTNVALQLVDNPDIEITSGDFIDSEFNVYPNNSLDVRRQLFIREIRVTFDLPDINDPYPHARAARVSISAEPLSRETRYLGASPSNNQRGGMREDFPILIRPTDNTNTNIADCASPTSPEAEFLFWGSPLKTKDLCDGDDGCQTNHLAQIQQARVCCNIFTLVGSPQLCSNATAPPPTCESLFCSTPGYSTKADIYTQATGLAPVGVTYWGDNDGAANHCEPTALVL